MIKGLLSELQAKTVEKVLKITFLWVLVMACVKLQSDRVATRTSATSDQGFDRRVSAENMRPIVGRECFFHDRHRGDSFRA